MGRIEVPPMKPYRVLSALLISAACEPLHAPENGFERWLVFVTIGVVGIGCEEAREGPLDRELKYSIMARRSPGFAPELQSEGSDVTACRRSQPTYCSGSHLVDGIERSGTLCTSQTSAQAAVPISYTQNIGSGHRR